jgi:hypothetical protein
MFIHPPMYLIIRLIITAFTHRGLGSQPLWQWVYIDTIIIIIMEATMAVTIMAVTP